MNDLLSRYFFCGVLYNKNALYIHPKILKKEAWAGKKKLPRMYFKISRLIDSSHADKFSCKIETLELDLFSKI